MIHTSDGQPLVGSPNILVLMMITIISINASTQNITPMYEAIDKGAVEKAIIPSIAYLVSPQRLHLVSP